VIGLCLYVSVHNSDLDLFSSCFRVCRCDRQHSSCDKLDHSFSPCFPQSHSCLSSNSPTVCAPHQHRSLLSRDKNRKVSGPSYIRHHLHSLSCDQILITRVQIFNIFDALSITLAHLVQISHSHTSRPDLRLLDSNSFITHFPSRVSAHPLSTSNTSIHYNPHPLQDTTHITPSNRHTHHQQKWSSGKTTRTRTSWVPHSVLPTSPSAMRLQRLFVPVGVSLDFPASLPLHCFVLSCCITSHLILSTVTPPSLSRSHLPLSRHTHCCLPALGHSPLSFPVTYPSPPYS
jgi:hypothetical protein